MVRYAPFPLIRLFSTIAFFLASSSIPIFSFEVKSAQLTFCGDLMAHLPNFTVRDFDALHTGVKDVLTMDDLSFVNLETPVVDTYPYTSFPQFNVHSEYVWAAIEAGFDVFSLANNHSADRGAGGVPKTDVALAMLKIQAAQIDRDIWYNGLRPRPSSPPFQLTRFEKNGISIGFVALAELVNIPSLKRWVQYTDCREGTVADPLLEWIRKVRPQVDVFILSYHWGEEYMPRQNEVRAKFSRKLVDAGVDIIWGNHPHVLQPWYTLKSQRGQALVLPSLGNYLSGQIWDLNSGDARSMTAAKGDSALFSVELSVDFTGHICFPHMEPLLISSWKNPNGQMVTRTLDDLCQKLVGPWREYYVTRRSIIKKTFIQLQQP